MPGLRGRRSRRAGIEAASYLARHGRPVAFYSDKASIFRVNRKEHRGDGLTQFGRAMTDLNIDVICANTAPAKERLQKARTERERRLLGTKLRALGAAS